MKGRVFMIRYADDMVLGFACEGDAQRVRAVLPKRLAEYGLTIHPEKTRVVPFGCPQPEDDDPDLGSFDFLGFTHHWGRSLKGNWVVKRKTACSRFRRAIRRIAQWCRLNRHQPVAEQHQALTIKLRGHYGYYGITGNGRSLKLFCNEVCHLWRKWLARRNRERSLSWIAYTRLLKRYPLPQPRVVHSVYRRTAKP